MVLVLRKVSINQSLAQAVQITMTTKVFSVVVVCLIPVRHAHARVALSLGRRSVRVGRALRPTLKFPDVGDKR
jgi:hypothetical protein